MHLLLNASVSGLHLSDKDSLEQHEAACEGLLAVLGRLDSDHENDDVEDEIVGKVGHALTMLLRCFSKQSRSLEV